MSEVESNDESSQTMADSLTIPKTETDSSPSLDYEIVDSMTQPSDALTMRPLSIEDIHDNFLVKLPMTATLQSTKNICINMLKFLGVIDGQPKEEFAFEWIIKDWQGAAAQLHKKQDVLSPVYRSQGYEWRLKLRKDKGTKRLGIFIEMVGAIRGGFKSADETSRVSGGDKPIFAAIFGLGFGQCFDARHSMMESTKRAVIFRPGEYQWGWAKRMTFEALESDFVLKNCVAVRAVIRVL